MKSPKEARTVACLCMIAFGASAQTPSADSSVGVEQPLPAAVLWVAIEKETDQAPACGITKQNGGSWFQVVAAASKPGLVFFRSEEMTGCSLQQACR